MTGLRYWPPRRGPGAAVSSLPASSARPWPCSPGPTSMTWWCSPCSARPPGERAAAAVGDLGRASTPASPLLAGLSVAAGRGLAAGTRALALAARPHPARHGRRQPDRPRSARCAAGSSRGRPRRAACSAWPALTIVNGADDLAAYTPFFAAAGWAQITVTLVVFAACVAPGAWRAACSPRHERVTARHRPLRPLDLAGRLHPHRPLPPARDERAVSAVSPGVPAEKPPRTTSDNTSDRVGWCAGRGKGIPIVSVRYLVKRPARPGCSRVMMATRRWDQRGWAHE